MNIQPTLEEWNYQELMLVQALLGAISCNFRMIALFWEEGGWVIRFYLGSESDEDSAEIEDVICQYDAYQESALKIRSETIIGGGKLPLVSEVGRIVFRRRENG